MMPVVFVSDMDASVAFYEKLGFLVKVQSRTGDWTELAAGDAILALHREDRVPQSSEMRVEISLVADEPLRSLADRLEEAGVEAVQPVLDESFGYSMVIRDPDGLPIQINQHDTDLYA